MSCQKCNSERVMHVSAKCSDMFNASIGDKEHEGYVLQDVVFGQGGWGDYIAFDLCLDCGQMQGKWPNPPTALESWEGWPTEVVERWVRQMHTPYDELPDSFKEAAKAEARKILNIIRRGGQ